MTYFFWSPLHHRKVFAENHTVAAKQWHLNAKLLFSLLYVLPCGQVIVVQSSVCASMWTSYCSSRVKATLDYKMLDLS